MNEPNSRLAIHVDATLGERAARWLTELLGSWRYLIGQSLFMALWIILNLFAWLHRWDVYPFILLNLLLSTQASFAAPLLQLSSNRIQRLDRARDDLEAKEVEELVQMQQVQLDILHELRVLQYEIHSFQQTLGKRLVGPEDEQSAAPGA